MNDKGLLIVISGPAGSGKGTVIKHIMGKSSSFAYSVSATTRNPRPGEIHGTSYYFITHEEFMEKINNGTMLEYAEYCGNYYGTPKDKVTEQLESGKNVILEIEVEGAMQVKSKCPEAVLVMLLPPDFKTLEARLRGRATETEEVILRRLNKAKDEISRCKKYDYVVLNHNKGAEKAAEEIICISIAEKKRTERCKEIEEHFYE